MVAQGPYCHLLVLLGLLEAVRYHFVKRRRNQSFHYWDDLVLWSWDLVDVVLFLADRAVRPLVRIDILLRRVYDLLRFTRIEKSFF